MKNIRTIILIILPFFLSGCSKNNDNPGDPLEMEILPPQGLAYIPGNTNTIVMNLEDGSIDNLLGESFIAPLVVDNSIFYISGNSIYRASTIGSAIQWEFEFPVGINSDNRFNRSSIVKIGDFLFVNYYSVDLTTYESTYRIQQVEVNVGLPGWSIAQPNYIDDLNVFNGNLLTREITDPGSEIVVRKRDKANGNILNEYLNVLPVVNIVPVGNAVIVVSQANKIVSLNDSLNENWEYSSTGLNGVFGLMDQGNFVYYSYSGNVTAVDLATGNLVWTTFLGTEGAKGLYKKNDSYLTLTVHETSLDIHTINPASGDVENMVTLTLAPDNQFDDFGATVFEEYIFFEQGFNGPSAPDPILTMALLDGSVLWTKTIADTFYTQWLLQTPTGSYFNGYIY